jgi:PTS system N-acetylglucosamine-specific IIC component
MDLLGVRLGFGFSAGLFDYVLNYGKATNPLLMLPVGLLYGLVYYGTFRFVIARFSLGTPGREPEDTPVAVAGVDRHGNAAAVLRALGGAANVRALDACTTRLRVVVANQSAVDDAALKALGARGLIRPTADTLQVVVGPVADQLAGEIRKGLRSVPPGAGPALDCAALVAALGGANNVRSVEANSTRLLIGVADDLRVDEAALAGASPRGFARPSTGSLHVIVGPGVADSRETFVRLVAK